MTHKVACLSVEKFRLHREKIEKEERNREEKVEKLDMQRQSFELMGLCKRTIKENCNIWKDMQEERLEDRKKQERLEKARIKKKESYEKELQKKLMKKWLQLPEREKIKYREKEEKRKD